MTFTTGHTVFVIARTVTGIGAGAELAIVNTYGNAASLGAFLTVGRGLVLATPAALFPWN